MSAWPSRRMVLRWLALTGTLMAGTAAYIGPPPSGYYLSATPAESPDDGKVIEFESLGPQEQILVGPAIDGGERPFVESMPAGIVGEYVRYEGELYAIMATGQHGPSEPGYLAPLVGGSLLACLAAVGLLVPTVRVWARRAR